ncbi:hypothetical protein M427DRAFT_141488 [Gonapodya prolifera JEL478]|uniref:Uncharacterized protein n=1 Tax=Gonapodya prolifera (strain JEL478) TaxID=1344416 RepID=A0A138ZX58_GONPJ|nr:hypothetical protein M427DRAFT_141488 [Gonapodya prolifera JEL478]|eukprot:KXS09034.1 hypothetical protein M427DRAFT_141488 [Gonapodya prolifera JEL478]
MTAQQITQVLQFPKVTTHYGVEMWLKEKCMPDKGEVQGPRVLYHEPENFSRTHHFDFSRWHDLEEVTFGWGNVRIQTQVQDLVGLPNLRKLSISGESTLGISEDKSGLLNTLRLLTTLKSLQIPNWYRREDAELPPEYEEFHSLPGYLPLLEEFGPVFVVSGVFNETVQRNRAAYNRIRYVSAATNHREIGTFWSNLNDAFPNVRSVSATVEGFEDMWKDSDKRRRLRAGMREAVKALKSLVVRTPQRVRMICIRVRTGFDSPKKFTSWLQEAIRGSVRAELGLKCTQQYEIYVDEDC